MKLGLSDIIQISGIVVALLLGIISIIISIITMRQNAKFIKEGNMAYIEVFPYRPNGGGNPVPQIAIKNFGKSRGTIIDIKTDPEIPIEDSIDNPFLYYKNISLAPNQSFVTIFSKSDMMEPPLKEFDLFISYETLGEVINSKIHINYGFLDGLLEVKISADDERQILNNINQSIQGLRQI